MRRFWQQMFPRINWRYIAVSVGLLLLSACGKNPEMPEVERSYDDCWPCAVYEATFQAIDTFLETLMEHTCEYAVLFMGIGLLFYILLHTTKTILLPIQEPNIRKFVFPLTTTLFKAIIVWSLIHNGEDYINFIGENLIQPVLMFFSGLSKEILNSNDIVRNATVTTSVASHMSSTSKLFGEAEGEFLDVIYKMYVALYAGIAIGFRIWTQPGIVTFFLGLFVLCMYFTLMLTMPMSFIDSFIRIAAMLILSPFCLVGWIFPPTRNWLKKVWGVFFGACITVMFSCIYIALTTYVIITYVDQKYPGLLGNAMTSMSSKLNEDVNTLSTSVIAFFVLIFSMNKLSKYVPKIANSFGAETVDSTWIRVFGGLKQLSIAATKAALAIALASPTLAKSAAEDAKKVALDAAKAAK